MKAQETKTIPKGYKQTEVGVIPEDWDVKKLGEISRVIMGQSPGSENYNCERVGLPLIQGNADVKNRKTIDRVYTRMITKRGVKGNVIMSVRAPVGEISKATFDCCLGRGVCAIDFSNNYLYHYLINFEKSWKQFSKGSTFDSINSKEVRELEIVLPSSEEEQTDIATILSDTDTLIENLEKLIAKKKAVKQGAMQGLLTGKRRLPGFSGEWEKKKLSEIGEITGSGIDKKSNKDEAKVRLVNYLDVFHRDFIYSKDLNHWVTASTAQLQKCKVKTGDIFFTPSSEMRYDIAVSAVAMEDIDSAGYSYHVIRFRLFEDWDLLFRAYIFKTKFFINQAETVCEGSGKRYVISLTKFREMSIKYPPDVKEQKAISSVLYEVDCEIKALERKLNKYKNIKIGMMQQLLTGKIRIYDKQKS